MTTCPGLPKWPQVMPIEPTLPFHSLHTDKNCTYPQKDNLNVKIQNHNLNQKEGVTKSTSPRGIFELKERRNIPTALAEGGVMTPGGVNSSLSEITLAQ